MKAYRAISDIAGEKGNDEESLMEDMLVQLATNKRELLNLKEQIIQERKKAIKILEETKEQESNPFESAAPINKDGLQEDFNLIIEKFECQLARAAAKPDKFSECLTFLDKIIELSKQLS